MDLDQLQREINTAGRKPPLEDDGRIGKKTLAALDWFLDENKVAGWSNWSDARRRIAAEQVVYKNAKLEVGTIDGLVGELTRHARAVYEARAANGGKPVASVETWRDKNDPTAAPVKVIVPAAPVKTRWPLQNESAMNAFFGARGTNQVRFTFPFPMRIAWEPERSVTSCEVNRLVLASEQRIWKRVLDFYGYDQIKKLRLDMYGGMLNVRKMRGGSAWSIHSWGCARDVDPDRNQLNMRRADASLDDEPYKFYWQCVYDEGAIGLGPERDYDWMHYQYARLK